jgi:electron transfer flavoprotein beta subunit
MDVLACIKRVPDTGTKIVLTDDQQGIDTSNLGFTMSPHEECAIEEAIQQTEEHGGTARVLTLGPEEATEQLRTGLAMQADEATLLETQGEEWGAQTTANAIADAVRDHGDGDVGFDLLLFGNESADAANYQVGIRVATELGIPCVTGIKSLDVEDGTATAKREVPGGEEIYEVDLPALVTVKEGINEPRYASMRAKMQARRKEVETMTPDRKAESGSLEMVRLEAPERDESRAEILGDGTEAVPRVIEVLEEEVEVL